MSRALDTVMSLVEARILSKQEGIDFIIMSLETFNFPKISDSFDIGTRPVVLTYRVSLFFNEVEEMGKGIECRLFGLADLIFPYGNLVKSELEFIAHQVARDAVLNAEAIFNKTPLQRRIKKVVGSPLTYNINEINSKLVNSGDMVKLDVMFHADYPRITNR